ncbi:MAG: NPCBM/NEW2 domain-containing protein [Planctomycetaceae bacterium]|nr:NPCBM/NEW2 domain-containing protein [Planctomycetaceae bacterium]
MLRIIFFFLLLVMNVYGSEVPFEVTDTEGHTVSGTIITIDSNHLVLDIDGTKTEIATEKIVKLQNLLDNPFLSTVSDGSDESSVYSSSNNRPSRKQSSKSIAALLQKQNTPPSQKENKQNENENEKETKTKPIFPEIVSVLELNDQSRLVVTEFSTKGKTVECRPLNSEKITLPLEQLWAVRLVVKGLNEVTDPPDDWKKLAALPGQPTTGDRIVVGSPGSLDIYTGILTEIGNDIISFIIDGATLPVPRRKVFGLLFQPPRHSQDSTKETTKTTQTPIGSLSLWNGTTLRLQTLKSDENRQWHWTTVSGVAGTLLPEEIDVLDLGRKNAFYLTDLKPVLLEQTFYFDRETDQMLKVVDQSNADGLRLLRNYRTQKIISQISNTENNTNDNALSILPFQSRNDSRQSKIPELPIPGLNGFVLDGNFYEHGFAIPAKTVLEYSLPIADSFTAFRAVVGIDDRLRPYGGVRFRVQAEQQLLGDWEFYGDEPAKLLKLPLPPNTKTLKFEIDFLQGITVPAILTLAEPTLMK